MQAGFNWRATRQMLVWCNKQGYTLVHSHGYRFDILLNCFPQRMRKVQVVSTLHGFTGRGWFSRLRVYQWLSYWCLLRADRVVAVSQGLYHRLQHRSGSKFIPNGISPCTPEEGKAAARPLEQPYLLAMGRLSTEKAFDRLIHAFAESRAFTQGWHLVIAGEGEQRGALETLARARGVAHQTHFPGYIHEDQGWLQQASALVISSDTEGLPMVLLEAMRAHVPVIATPVGEIPEVLGQGALGFLVGACDRQSLTSGINRLLDEPERAASMQVAAHRQFKTQYTAAVMAERYYQTYRELYEDAVH